VIGIDEARLEALRLAAEYHTAQDRGIPRNTSGADPMIQTAGELAAWLRARPASIRVGNPTVSAGGNPAVSGPATRGADMAVNVKDSDFSITYPAPEALDSKGFQVADAITLTTDDTAGAFLTQQPANADGSTTFLIVGVPGAVQLTWSDGNLSNADTVNVLTGDAASIVVGAPVVNATDPNAAPDAPTA
jgi:hypothetical protein